MLTSSDVLVSVTAFVETLGLDNSMSKEEGCFPDLQMTAEEHLQMINPNSSVLLKEEPCLTRSTMDNEDWLNELKNWEKNINIQDSLLKNDKNINIVDQCHQLREGEPIDLTPRALPQTNSDERKKLQKNYGICNYEAWDKFDADSEIEKIEIEDKREKEQISQCRKKEEHEQNEKRKQLHEETRLKVEVTQNETTRLEALMKYSDTGMLSDAEKEIFALQEKNRGNEYYTANEFSEAIRSYTASILIHSTAEAYNNRAACYLKQCRYSLALADTNRALSLDPTNIKALFRRSIALQHKNKFKEALDDMIKFVNQEPGNLLAQRMIVDLRDQVKTLPRTVRVMSKEGNERPKVIEVSSSDLPRLSKNSYEVNEWGLPKIMCQCNSKPHPRKCTTSWQAAGPSRIMDYSATSLESKPSNKLNIVEVQKCNAYFAKPAGCAVVDKRFDTKVNCANEDSKPCKDDSLNDNSASGSASVDYSGMNTVLNLNYYEDFNNELDI